jgi:hypothetical protein
VPGILIFGQQAPDLHELTSDPFCEKIDRIRGRVNDRFSVSGCFSGSVRFPFRASGNDQKSRQKGEKEEGRNEAAANESRNPVTRHQFLLFNGPAGAKQQPLEEEKNEISYDLFRVQTLHFNRRDFKLFSLIDGMPPAERRVWHSEEFSLYENTIQSHLRPA